jgi:hypothetical protein
MFEKIKDLLWPRALADLRDSSITVNRKLFTLLGGGKEKILVFRERGTKNYCLCTVSDKWLEENHTQVCFFQYNEKFKSIGFTSICPTVSSIFYETGITEETHKFRLKRVETKDRTYYKLIK